VEFGLIYDTCDTSKTNGYCWRHRQAEWRRADADSFQYTRPLKVPLGLILLAMMHFILTAGNYRLATAMLLKFMPILFCQKATVFKRSVKEDTRLMEKTSFITSDWPEQQTIKRTIFCRPIIIIALNKNGNQSCSNTFYSVILFFLFCFCPDEVRESRI